MATTISITITIGSTHHQIPMATTITIINHTAMTIINRITTSITMT